MTRSYFLPTTNRCLPYRWHIGGTCAGRWPHSRRCQLKKNRSICVIWHRTISYRCLAGDWPMRGRWSADARPVNGRLSFDTNRHRTMINRCPADDQYCQSDRGYSFSLILFKVHRDAIEDKILDKFDNGPYWPKYWPLTDHCNVCFTCSSVLTSFLFQILQWNFQEDHIIIDRQ